MLTLKLYATLHVRTLHAAISMLPTFISITERVGLEDLVWPNGRAANVWYGAGTCESGGSRETQLVSSVTLDTHLGGSLPPKVLKIDVGGCGDSGP
jgi:hypothetical protein